jgi:hypothetical protein
MSGQGFWGLYEDLPPTKDATGAPPAPKAAAVAPAPAPKKASSMFQSIGSQWISPLAI